MYVRMLTAMAGEKSYGFGDIANVEDRIGEAWIKAGIAEAPPSEAASEKHVTELVARVDALEAALSDAVADRDALREQIAALVEQNEALTAAAKAKAKAPAKAA